MRVRHELGSSNTRHKHSPDNGLDLQSSSGPVFAAEYVGGRAHVTEGDDVTEGGDVIEGGDVTEGGDLIEGGDVFVAAVAARDRWNESAPPLSRLIIEDFQGSTLMLNWTKGILVWAPLGRRSESGSWAD